MPATPPRIRRVQDLPDETWAELAGGTTWRGLFSRETTGTDSLCSGLARVPVGGHWPVHRHAAAELYLVVSGRGSLRVGDEQVDVSAGTAVHIAPWEWHGVRTQGEEELTFFYVFDAASQDDVVYEFASTPGGGT